MAGSHGKFVWHELMTTDVKAAGALYGKVFGWSVEGEGHAHINTGGQSIGGIMELSKHLSDVGVRPHWGGYIDVDDVDAYAAKGNCVNKAGLTRCAKVRLPRGRLAPRRHTFPVIHTHARTLTRRNRAPFPAVPRNLGHSGERPVHPYHKG